MRPCRSGRRRRPKAICVIDKIIDACKQTGAEAVHPGYGFLSEREAFPKALASAGIVFIGPNPDAIAAMGDKIESKKAAASGQGLDRAGPSRRDRRREAGGEDRRRDRLSGDDQGLRRRRRQGHADRAFARPRSPRASPARRSEAKSSFGDDRVFIEKFIVDPRHIEIQVLGDKHGNVIYLGERECSIQRRNQKVIEEAPSPLLDAATRKKMGEQAVALAKAVGYDCAGTVEFVAGQDKSFYFLEMNTRLQVEHPVTELITGIDLVEQMIRVAAGEKLAIKQSDVKLDRLGGREPRLCRGSVPQFPALDRPADALPPAGGNAHGRHHGAQRHRRLRGRRDFDLLRSDDRQARDPCADARGGDRRAGRRARCLRDRRHPPQHSVPVGADAASALAGGQALDRLHRRGISRRLSSRVAPEGEIARRAGRGRRRDRPRARRAQAPHFRPDDAAAPVTRERQRAVWLGEQRDRARRHARGRRASRCASTAATGQASTSLASDWKPGDPVWTGTIDGQPVAVQVRPVPNGFDLAHPRRRDARLRLHRARGRRRAADAGEDRRPTPARQLLLPDAGARGLDRGDAKGRRSRPARRSRWSRP